MKRVLIVGAGKGGSALIELLHHSDQLKIVAVIDLRSDALGIKLAKKYEYPTGEDWKAWIDRDIDIVIEATGIESVYEAIIQLKQDSTIIVSGDVERITSSILQEKDMLLHNLQEQKQHQDLILNHMDEGMIVVDAHETITFVNRRAVEIIGDLPTRLIGKPIRKIIDHSRLPHTLRSCMKEMNREFVLPNGKKVITSRVPIIDSKQTLVGAFAVFRDMTDVANLAEQVTGLKEVKKMLEAIFYSSQEAISVVDESGRGIMINPAYSNITGLKEEDVVGKPASTDISEGESIHMKVLQTRRAVRGARMRVGPTNKEVIVNVAPIIVDGKLKGSVGVLHDVSEIQRLTNDLKQARQIIRKLENNYSFDDIIGESSELIVALEQAKVSAKMFAPVLLRGETGTGKVLFAHAIHNESSRKHNKFIHVHCAGAESDMENQLFGYIDNTYETRIGYFEEANNGTIFLDEIGKLSLSVQARLLRVLEKNEVVRVGETNPVNVDVRVITSTNENLEKGIMQGSFREDLYYRLNRLPVFIPALRERLADLRILTLHLIEKMNKEYGRRIKGVEEGVFRYLESYHWPGNIRELENVISQAMINMEVSEQMILKKHLPSLLQQSSQINSNEFVLEKETLQVAIERHEKKVIEKALHINGYNKTKTATDLGISIRSLYYKMEKHDLSREKLQ
ncbi:sigma 54-interacting transcriptional regulator [Aquibacillus kalidii]|uniref:sigma 54-interacting transcriptional regulator n=1 Tax=Aquibacillus kalidii TaxID=2762597 RepID=UPI00164573D8|nr:sigma 54-interacting transcriptional regulator [Aquibacillus kalidii]